MAQGEIDPFCFSAAKEDDLLFYDLQTQLHGNFSGRHGSGRSGIYHDHYLKGVGRTPAAANWSNGSDIYHGSGHLSVASAIRERLITAFAEVRGLGAAIVPCQAVLIRALTQIERRNICRGRSSSRPQFAPADGKMIALTVKPADFARISNFVFALNHVSGSPQELGTLFLDLEYYLQPPDLRQNLDGSPHAIARALDQAFHRGLQNFHAFARNGLLWLFLNSNFSLDGRFLDLETPLFFGAPFVGLSSGRSEGANLRELVGFEEFGFVLHWRLFIAWLKARLHFLTAPEIAGGHETRPFLRELHRRIVGRFSRRHLLYRDTELIRRTASNLADRLALAAADRARVTELARCALAWRMYDAQPTIPNLHWRALDFAPAPATPFPRTFKAPAFIPSSSSPDAEAFANAVARLGSICQPAELVRALAKPETFIPAEIPRHLSGGRTTTRIRSTFDRRHMHEKR